MFKTIEEAVEEYRKMLKDYIRKTNMMERSMERCLSCLGTRRTITMQWSGPQNLKRWKRKQKILKIK